MNKTTRTILDIVLVIITAIALLTSGKQYTTNQSLSSQLSQLEDQRIQLQNYSDSLLLNNEQQLEQIQALEVDNQQIKTLNRQLSQLASQRQKVKYVTSSAHLQVIRDSLDAVVNNYIHQRLTNDSLLEKLQITELDYQEREGVLLQELYNCQVSQPNWPLTFSKSDPYIEYSITIPNDSTAHILFQTKDTLNFAHTTERSWFLGRKKYNVFATSQSPYSTTKTHSYVFKNRSLFDFLKRDTIN